LALGALHEVAGGANGALDGAAAALFAAGILARTHGQILWCVTFITIENETGVPNLVVWADLYERSALPYSQPTCWRSKGACSQKA
jgi:hypothetical protein